MAMPPGGTFRHTANVVRSRDRGGVSLAVEPSSTLGPSLVGCSPSLSVTDAGPTPSPGWNRGTWMPLVHRSRWTLRASGRHGATVAAAAFHVDSEFTAALEPGDIVHMARTECAGIGVSVLRDGVLLGAAGAVAAVPLGPDLAVGYPRGLVSEIERVLRELPVEIRSGARRRLFGAGSTDFGEYEVFVVHGSRQGIPGEDACVAVSRRSVFSASATSGSAYVLDRGAIEMLRWHPESP